MFPLADISSVGDMPVRSYQQVIHNAVAEATACNLNYPLSENQTQELRSILENSVRASDNDRRQRFRMDVSGSARFFSRPSIQFP